MWLFLVALLLGALKTLAYLEMLDLPWAAAMSSSGVAPRGALRTQGAQSRGPDGGPVHLVRPASI